MNSRFPPRRGVSGLATAAFAAHAGLIAFSTVAMLTVLARPPGPWLADEPGATIMRLSFRHAGAACVALGGVTMLLYLGGAVRWPKALALFATGAAISLGAELLGTSTGLPFGDYRYGTRLGALVLGLVPWPIPVSWFYMLVASLAIVARLRPAADDRATRWRWALLAGALLLAWDVSMDPAMVRTGHWAWGSGRVFADAPIPGWLASFFTHAAFYGMPLGNWFGWFLTGTLIARAMLAVMPPTTVAERVAAARLPVLLYLANGVMPVALCLRDGLWWAGAGGGLLMAVPALAALGRAPARGQSRVPTSAQPA